MAKANTRLRSDGTSVVTRVAGYVREHITRQQLPRGAALPSYRDLAAELNVGYTTVKLAMDLLAREGVVNRERARGCYVNREISAQGKPLKTIGIVYPASCANLFAAPYLRQIMQGIGEAAVRVDVNMFSLRDEGLVTASQLADRHVDGVILLGVENDDLLRDFASWNVPGVVADYCSPTIPLDFAACDNAGAAAYAVRHLVALGHRNIRYLARDPHLVYQIGKDRTLLMRSSDSVERREAVVHALGAQAGVRWSETAFFFDSYVDEWVADWQGGADRPTAILVDDESTAIGVLGALEKANVRVPEDASVCAVAVVDGTAATVTLTGARFDFVGMGRKTVELLRRRCEQPAKAIPPAVCRIGFEWVQGRTCGARA